MVRSEHSFLALQLWYKLLKLHKLVACAIGDSLSVQRAQATFGLSTNNNTSRNGRDPGHSARAVTFFDS